MPALGWAATWPSVPAATSLTCARPSKGSRWSRGTEHALGRPGAWTRAGAPRCCSTRAAAVASSGTRSGVSSSAKPTRACAEKSARGPQVIRLRRDPRTTRGGQDPRGPSGKGIEARPKLGRRGPGAAGRGPTSRTAIGIRRHGQGRGRSRGAQRPFAPAWPSFGQILGDLVSVWWQREAQHADEPAPSPMWTARLAGGALPTPENSSRLSMPAFAGRES